MKFSQFIIASFAVGVFASCTPATIKTQRDVMATMIVASRGVGSVVLEKRQVERLDCIHKALEEAQARVCIAQVDARYSPVRALADAYYSALAEWNSALRLYEDGTLKEDELLRFALETVGAYRKLSTAMKEFGVDLPKLDLGGFRG